MTGPSAAGPGGDSAAGQAMSDTAPPRGRARTVMRLGRRVRRLALMLLVPAALAAAGGYVWVTGGRFVSTDNAYLRQDKVTIGADVAGRIAEVAVRENERVEPGQLLFRIDPESYRIALQQAEAALAAARLQVEQMRAAYRRAVAAQKATDDQLTFQRGVFARQRSLLASGYTPRAKYDETESELQTAVQRAVQARQEVESAKAALTGDPAIHADDHPLVMQAIARRDAAALDLDRTGVLAPSGGLISQTARLQPGQYIAAGTAVLSLVETADSWIEANFKETDLTYLRVGQHATVAFDAFPDVTLSATVESVGAGTGAEFSLLPAQNATGNWVKVVQRVPVRLRLSRLPPELALRTGLSADVEVDTGHVRPLPAVIGSALAWVGMNRHGAAAPQ